MGTDPLHPVGVGDAENDHALLDCCGLGAAVANALPSIKSHADVVLERDHGAGVSELVERVLAGTVRTRASKHAAKPDVRPLGDPVDVRPEAGGFLEYFPVLIVPVTAERSVQLLASAIDCRLGLATAVLVGALRKG